MMYIDVALTGFIATFFSIFVVRHLCDKLDIVDHPGGRKDHAGVIPLAGGPSLLLSLIIAHYLGFLNSHPAIMLAACLLILIGIWDDRFGVRALTKFLAQLASAALIVIGGGIVVTNIGVGLINELSGNYMVAIVVTIVAVTGLINAFNMIDGIDGLCSGLALTCLGFILISLTFNNSGLDPNLLKRLVFVAAAICVFLAFNLGLIPRRKIFLGDSGSMLLGLILSASLIQVAEGQLSDYSYFPSSLVLWSVTVPVFDTLATASRRILRGVSPMSPDRTHIHHIIMLLGLSPRQTLAAILAISAILYVFGLTVTLNFGDSLATSAWFLTFIIYYVAIGRARKKYKETAISGFTS